VRGSAGRRRALATTLAVAAGMLAVAAGPASASRNATAGERAAIVRGALGADYPVRCVHVRVSTAAAGWAATGNVFMRPDARRHRAFCERQGAIFDGTAFLRRAAPGRWRMVVSGSAVDTCEPVPLGVQRDLFRFARAMGCPAFQG
jgi:hypothetical protein